MLRRKMLIPFLLTMLITVSFQQSQDPYAEKRKQMVEDQIRGREVHHRGILEAMERVARHRFVPSAQRPFAYHDRPLPIGFGQTISQPYIVGYMTQIIDPRPHYKVLEIGTGSGYQAAILAELAAQVYTIEIIPELGHSAEHLLNELYNNVIVKVGDGYYGWEEHAPFDAIVVTAASGTIPPPLVEQLKEGGKMVIPVGSPYMTQQLMLVEKKKQGYTTRSLIPVRFVPFRRSE